MTAVAGADARADAESPRPYVVVYERDAAERRGFSVIERTRALERSHRFASRMRFRHALDGFAARLTERQAERLRGREDVALVEPDREVRAAGRFPLNAGETVSTGIRRIGAVADSGVHGSSSVAVAVLDTGVDVAHQDLNAERGVNCTGEGPSDLNGHGTYVSGVIGAENDGSGIVGVAPGTRVYGVKVLDAAGSGSDSTLICGVDWVTANAAALNIRVANLSLGTDGRLSSCDTDPLHRAICHSTAAGVTYTVAAGNEGRDISGFPASVPATFPEVLTVTAMSDSDGLPGAAGGDPPCEFGERDDAGASFSNYATRQADIDHVVAAPGVCIRSTVPFGGYQTESGTSAAAPHVAGVVALCFGEGGARGACADMTPAEVIQQVRADAAAHATFENGFAGDPLHPTSVYFGHLTSAVDPAFRRIPLPPPPPPPPPPPAQASDRSPPMVRLSGRRLQRFLRQRGIILFASCNERCRLVATGSANVPRRSRSARRLRLRRLTRQIPGRLTVRLRLRLGRREVRSLRRALRGGRRVRATVSVVATDRSGNARRTRYRVVLRR